MAEFRRVTPDDPEWTLEVDKFRYFMCSKCEMVWEGMAAFSCHPPFLPLPVLKVEPELRLVGGKADA